MKQKKLLTAIAKEFESGGSWIIAENKYKQHFKGWDIVGRSEGKFVIPNDKVMNKILLEANGDHVKPPYDYVAKFSSAPGNADLSDLIYQGLLPYLHDHLNVENIKYTKQTLENLCESYQGLYSVASFILQASIYENNNDKIGGINLNGMAEHLTKSVIDHKDILLKYYSSLDSRCNLYDTIKILSKKTSSVGGPSFFSEEYNHGIKM